MFVATFGMASRLAHIKLTTGARLLVVGFLFLLLLFGIFLISPTTVEGELERIPETYEQIVFRALHGHQKRELSLFGVTIASIITDHELQGHEVSRNGKPVLWIDEGNGFYKKDGMSVLPKPGNQWVDYIVVPPQQNCRWKFRVDYDITQKFRFGPFRFRSAPQIGTYWSPVITNEVLPEVR